MSNTLPASRCSKNGRSGSPTAALLSAAKAAVLLASLVSGLIGLAILWRAGGDGVTSGQQA